MYFVSFFNIIALKLDVLEKVLMPQYQNAAANASLGMVAMTLYQAVGYGQSQCTRQE